MGQVCSETDELNSTRFVVTLLEGLGCAQGQPYWCKAAHGEARQVDYFDELRGMLSETELKYVGLGLARA